MFSQLDQLAADPILGLMAKYKQDPSNHKIDLGVGVFRTAEGETPVLQAVKQAEASLLANEASKAYVGPAGNQGFNQLMSELVLGADHPALRASRSVLIQTPGGCGALRVAAELIARARRDATVWVSDPTWANHIPLLGDAGIEIASYRYYEPEHRQIQFENMLADLGQAKAGDLVLLHACCHNPCGADLSREQWRQLCELMLQRGLTPFIDMAYQGFGDGLDEDAWGLRTMTAQLPEVIFAVSCSKNFGLYRERVGAIGVVCETGAQVPAVASHIMNIVRGMYSMPPSHGAAVVEHVLATPVLRNQWESELAQMRKRIGDMRRLLVDSMRNIGAENRFDYITGEKGMFSFLGLSEVQVDRLVNEYAIYMVGSSRINVAGLNRENMPRFCEAVMAVLD